MKNVVDEWAGTAVAQQQQYSVWCFVHSGAENNPSKLQMDQEQ